MTNARSNCCDAPVINQDFCADCKEHCQIQQDTGTELEELKRQYFDHIESQVSGITRSAWIDVARVEHVINSFVEWVKKNGKQ